VSRRLCRSKYPDEEGDEMTGRIAFVDFVATTEAHFGTEREADSMTDEVSKTLKQPRVFGRSRQAANSPKILEGLQSPDEGGKAAPSAACGGSLSNFHRGVGQFASLEVANRRPFS
jgi:hypothetical protein